MITRIAWIILLNLVVYWKTLYYGLVSDDVAVSEEKDTKFKGNKWKKRLGIFIGSFHVNSIQAHFINIIIHSINCVLIYLVFGMNDVSFLAAILFSVNPVNIQGSVWISGRNYATASVFSLLMIAFPYLSIIPYYLSSHFAFSAFCMPLVFLFTPYWYLLGMIPIIYFCTRKYRNTVHTKMWENPNNLKTTNTEMRIIRPRKLIIAIKTYAYYFILCLAPHTISIDYRFLYGFGTNQTDNRIGYKIDKFFWIGLILAATPFLSLFLGYRDIFYGLWWFSVNMVIWLNIITIMQQVSLRFVYMANIGMMYALANLIFLVGGAYKIPIATVFFVYYLTKLIITSRMYRNDYWAIEGSIQEEPKGHILWLMRGIKKYFAKDFQGAFYDFHEALIHKKYDFKILFNLSVTSLVIGDLKGSRNFLNLAKENIYDEMKDEVEPNIKIVEDMHKNVEEQLKHGPQIKLDLNKLLVVK